MHKPVDQLLSLNGNVALVTGAAMGIGRGIAERLHEAGANVVLVDIATEAVHAVSDELHAKRPGSSYAVVADVSDEASVTRCVDEAIRHFQKIDILVNNAGIFPNQPLASMSLKDFTKVIDVNLKSVYFFTKQVSEHMKSRGEGGKIINITSIDALHPSMVGLAHYDASKHAVWGFTKNTALELAEYGIWVNAVAPGGVATPGATAIQDGTDALPAEEIAALTEAFLQTIPMHRMGDPDDIAKVVLFMASDMSSYMTGTQVVVDGGVLLS